MYYMKSVYHKSFPGY